MSDTLRRPVLLLALIATLVLAACTTLAEAMVLPDLTSPLVTVTTRGGDCLDGPCGSTTVIERDGRVHQTAPTDANLGQLPGDILSALTVAIRATDFAAVRSVPFVGECPTAFDGQETIYEFGAPGGVERIASCESKVDPAQPVFAAVDAALIAVDVLPAP
jgi:hypothetical protein